MPDDFRYKGWVIEAQSYKSDGDRWRPKALVSVYQGGSVRVHQVPATAQRDARHRGERQRLRVEMAMDR
jgi:hypothetical protein